MLSVTNSTFNFHDTEVKTVWLTTCSLSILGSVSIIWVFLSSKRIRKIRLRQMLNMLSIFDFIAALGYLIGMAAGYTSGLGCKVLALLTIFAPVGAFIATDAISLFICLSTFSPQGKWRNMHVMPLFYSVCILIPTATVASVALLDIEGHDSNFINGVCWIKGTKDQSTLFLWHLLGGKFVEWFSFAFVLVCYIPTVYRLYKVDQALALKSRVTVRMLFVPAAFIVLRLPSTIRAVCEALETDETAAGFQVLSVLIALGDPGQGAANGLLYVAFSGLARNTLFRPCKKVQVGETSNRGDGEAGPSYDALENLVDGEDSDDFESTYFDESYDATDTAPISG